MAKPRILVQLDADTHASVFDAVVAVDAGVDHLLQYSGVTRQTVQGLVHGAIFTRSPKDLKNTAIFIGGSDVGQAERLLEDVRGCFFGPMCVSVMMDASGANTTAAAAVLAAARHVKLSSRTVLVLGGTGPVGRRVARLLAREGAAVRLASRSVERAAAACDELRASVGPAAELHPIATDSAESTSAALRGADVVIAAGAAGVELLSAELLRAATSLRVAIDLNAVPPLGIAGVQASDKAVQHGDLICYGAIGVGGTKMKIHSTAISRLFQATCQVFDAEEIYAIGRELEA
jgi:hypothetical protein